MNKKYFMPSYDYAVSSLLGNHGYVNVGEDESPDFLVFTGGADVSPWLYGEHRKPGTSTSPERDYWDMMAFIRFRHLPMVGICRGFQFLAAVTGHKLVQHIEDHTWAHTCYYNDEVFTVSSTHHQCVVHTNPLFVSADGVCEGAYLSAGVFGVQFHPEYESCSEQAIAAFIKELRHVTGV